MSRTWDLKGQRDPTAASPYHEPAPSKRVTNPLLLNSGFASRSRSRSLTLRLRRIGDRSKEERPKAIDEEEIVIEDEEAGSEGSSRKHSPSFCVFASRIRSC